ncbi:FAD/NAD(P)-binding protein [Pedobacter cryotolerans]|uniref:FAD-dependent urate hydroxylase HpyO/Asp monooxygenase CreE-like FAD/NAD(P)-binding domain-containing protein n=1 Tax=Pedobacter cryotolerans TaxID=2571270 RepID=A0A4U1BX44_9SPHI|nr:FAD/NAD(P)-binding protein [Pedobacter cryotolerans]TKB97105.1 hypothetical protein FA045_17100 [Pedobacter cryotolerans]
MNTSKSKIRIAILGGGPSGLFMFKRIVEANQPNFEVTIFERKNQLGAGMPYSTEGASDEHITNVSDNEVPNFVNSIEEWVDQAPQELLDRYQIKSNNFNEYKVLPRLFFGAYLQAQFEILLQQAVEKNIDVEVKTNCNVDDVIYKPELNEVWILADQNIFKFDKVVIATGHNWPKKYEGLVQGYFDSPYPPAKLALKLNHPIALKGSSLTAIDAIRTLARHNGSFAKNEDGKLTYQLAAGSENFSLLMHSRNGLLPAVRFHLEDSRLRNDSLLSIEDFKQHREENEGFVSLDFVFEKDFKEIFKEKDPSFYEQIKDMDVETFVDAMMELREKLPPFQLLKAEYVQAEKSIKRKESIYWKEMLAILSFSMNYPAKYFSAEDMLRLQKKLMPLISIVIAFVPQSSCEELIALHDAGVLDIVSVGNDSEVEIADKGGIIYHYTDENDVAVAQAYQTFVDCVGQPHLDFDKFVFDGLKEAGAISSAKLNFKDQEIGAAEFVDNEKVKQSEDQSFTLDVPGITINDHFQIVDERGEANPHLFIMAVPYIGGFNPDYSGIDFSEEASQRIIAKF